MRGGEARVDGGGVYVSSYEHGAGTKCSRYGYTECFV